MCVCTYGGVGCIGGARRADSKWRHWRQETMEPRKLNASVLEEEMVRD